MYIYMYIYICIYIYVYIYMYIYIYIVARPLFSLCLLHVDSSVSAQFVAGTCSLAYWTHHSHLSIPVKKMVRCLCDLCCSENLHPTKEPNASDIHPSNAASCTGPRYPQWMWPAREDWSAQSQQYLKGASLSDAHLGQDPIKPQWEVWPRVSAPVALIVWSVPWLCPMALHYKYYPQQNLIYSYEQTCSIHYVMIEIHRRQRRAALWMAAWQSRNCVQKQSWRKMQA